jgi:ADP-ribose pyrophosphatase YjhB (NUDIX family)
MSKKWYEFDPTVDIAKVSAGIILILNNSKILFVHPSKSGWRGSYSVPKGGVNDGESLIDAAIRELFEETSVVITSDKIENPNDPIIINYTNKEGSSYKKLFLFKVHINDTSQIGMCGEVIDKSKLQLIEVDWGGFLDKKEAQTRIFKRINLLLDLI